MKLPQLKGKSTPTELLKMMRDHFEQFNFTSVEKTTFGFNGEMVKNIVQHEWVLSNVTFSDEPVFHINNGIDEAFHRCLPLVDKLPFSVVEMKNIRKNSSEDEQRSNDDVLSLMKRNLIVLKKTTFCSPAASTAFFHKQLRERKIWWRKFSALPSRFSVTEITISDAKDEQNVEIHAEFPWGCESVEQLRWFNRIQFENPEYFQVKEGRKTFTPHLVTNKCYLEKSTMVYLCDAYDKINEETDRELMRFHRKLAPFKITFAASGPSANVGQELSDLALVLARKIRKLGLSCLLLPDMTRRSLESQFLRADAMGIPYTIVLNEKTLHEGMIGIRNRDTTLKEQSHVGVVVSYVDKLFKNY